ncbi:MAG TPA: sulfatase-like hydrolase/transferase [Limnochordia bacterium]
MPDGRPNILLLFTDQQRWDALGAAGNSIIKTPVLDGLARRGVLFARAYTPSPVCVAARGAVMTGLLPHRTGCFNNGFPLARGVPTLMQLLSEAGYQTHAVGKMHFSPPRVALGFESMELSEEIPVSAEADDFLQFLHARGYAHVHEPHGIRSDMYYIPQVSQLPAELHTTAWTAERTIAFLRRRDRRRPFFLWTSFIKPHPPFDPPVPWNKLYRSVDMPLPHCPPGSAGLQTWWMRHQNRYKYRESGPDLNLLRSMKAAYYACVSFIDYHIGRILNLLRQTGESENTLILFASDHGELLGDYHSFGKRSFLDAAARVPLIAVWPGHFPAGAVCERPVSLVDLMPTCLAAAGIDPGPYRLDGSDLREAVAREGGEALVLGQLDRRGRAVYMAFDGRWKYVYSAGDRREYLFDLEADPQETMDHFERAPAEAARLRRALCERFRRDGYEEPFVGEQWREFDVPPERAPDDDRIFQEARWTDPWLRVPGYGAPPQGG